MPLTNQLPAMGQGICFSSIHASHASHACPSRPGIDIDRVLPDCVTFSFRSPIYYYLQNAKCRRHVFGHAVSERLEVIIIAPIPIRFTGRLMVVRRPGNWLWCEINAASLRPGNLLGLWCGICRT